MLGSLLDYARCFIHCIALREERTLLRTSLRRPESTGPLDDATVHHALSRAVGWLCLAQDHGRDGGLGSYHLVDDWGAPYPETTGYIIPTLLAAAERLGRPELRERAVRAGTWLLRMQRPDGGWQGGRLDEDRPSIVFNTAQVVRGLLALHEQDGGSTWLAAAERAAGWIISVQEDDGSWSRHNFLGAARVYDTYVDAPLLQLWRITGDDRLRAEVERNLAWVLQQQRLNGWFANADNTHKHNDQPITHTIAYTLDGLIACGRSLGEERLVRAAQKAADTLLDRFLADGRLHGRYDADWRGSEAAIVTGGAQLAIVWHRLWAITHEERYRTGYQRMLTWLVGVASMSERGPVDVRGAVPGSFPIWGRYEKFAFPNWATKYFADALLCAEQAV